MDGYDQRVLDGSSKDPRSILNMAAQRHGHLTELQ